MPQPIGYWVSREEQVIKEKQERCSIETGHKRWNAQCALCRKYLASEVTASLTPNPKAEPPYVPTVQEAYFNRISDHLKTFVRVPAYTAEDKLFNEGIATAIVGVGDVLLKQ